MATPRLSHAELQRRREARKNREYGTAFREKKARAASKTNKNGKYQNYPPPSPASREAKQEERVEWALRRLCDARKALAKNPDDRAWQAAVAARRAEYDNERAIYARLFQRAG